jgi:hypothetical protein
MMARRSCSGVPDDVRIAEALEWVRAALERTQAVANQLIGLNLHDANQLAARSGRQLRVVKREGNGLKVTADLATNRINIETEGDIVVAASSGLAATPPRSDAMKGHLCSPWDPSRWRLGLSTATREVGRPLWIDSTSGSTCIVDGR